MKFDMNMMQALMQMLGNNKSPHSDVNGNQADESANVAQSHAKTQSQCFDNKKQCVFAMQNGIGEDVQEAFEEIDAEKPTKECDAQKQSPINMFEMLSKFMPKNNCQRGENMPLSMLINMLSPKQQCAGCKQENNKDTCNKDTSCNQNDVINGDCCNVRTTCDMQKHNINSDMCDCAHNDNLCNRDKQNFDCQQLANKKTQQAFLPIAFAGYKVVCAVCKLYLTSRFDLDR